MYPTFYRIIATRKIKYDCQLEQIYRDQHNTFRNKTVITGGFIDRLSCEMLNYIERKQTLKNNRKVYYTYD